MKRKELQKGIIGKIVIIVVALILLKIFFKINIVEYIQKPEVQAMLHTIWDYIVKAALFCWSGVVYGWHLLGGFLEKIGV